MIEAILGAIFVVLGLIIFTLRHAVRELESIKEILEPKVAWTAPPSLPNCECTVDPLIEHGEVEARSEIVKKFKVPPLKVGKVKFYGWGSGGPIGASGLKHNGARPTKLTLTKQRMRPRRVAR